MNKGKLKVGAIEEGEGRKQESFEEKQKCLAVSLVKVQGLEVYGLMGSGVAPNVMYPKIVEKFSLKMDETTKVVTVATGTGPWCKVSCKMS